MTIDPLHSRAETLTTALTSARSTVTAADGLVQVSACADGEINVHIDDKVLVLGGPALAQLITELAAQALKNARTGAATALAQFRADPRVSDAVAFTVDAMRQPVPPAEQARGGRQ